MLHPFFITCRGRPSALFGALALALGACAAGQIGDPAPGGVPVPTLSYAADGGVAEPANPTGADGCKIARPPRSDSALFTNLQADCYYCRQPTFVDLVKAAECFRSGWTTCQNGRSAFATDAAGWPLAPSRKTRL